MARFAKRVLSIEPSATVRISDLITDLKARGEKILSLAIGEPDFPTPAHIVDAAKKALDDGYTKYTAAPGIRELREAIAEKSQKENGIPAKAENVIVAPTKHTLFMTFMSLLDPGCEARADPRGGRRRIRAFDGDRRGGDHPADPAHRAQLTVESCRLGVLAVPDAWPRGPR